MRANRPRASPNPVLPDLIRYPRWGAGADSPSIPSPLTYHLELPLTVIPNPLTVIPSEAEGTGPSVSQPRPSSPTASSHLTSSCRTPIGTHPLIRLTGLRSGTHGGVRAGARIHRPSHSADAILSSLTVHPEPSHCHPERSRGNWTVRLTTTPIIPDRVQPPHLVLPDSDRDPPSHSSYRTPIRYPRWGAGAEGTLRPWTGSM